MQENFSLKPYNTFGVEANAHYFTDVNNVDEYSDNEYGKEYLMKLVNDLYKRNIITYADKQDIKDRVNPFILIRSDYF